VEDEPGNAERDGRCSRNPDRDRDLPRDEKKPMPAATNARDQREIVAVPVPAPID